MKKIIESELISIAHRILKLKDKADIDALFNESKNVFEKISVLKFYEDNKFRIDPTITEEAISKALFETEKDKQNDAQFDEKFTFTNREGNHSNGVDAMCDDIIKDLIEDSENSEIVSFDDEFISETTPEVQQKVEVFVEDLQIELASEKKESFTEENLNVNSNIVSNENNEKVESEPEKRIVEIDPIFNIPLEEISFEQIDKVDTSDLQNLIPEDEKQPHFENQHLMDISDSNEVPFHQIPLNKTINDAFSHVITIGLNDRIAFEKNLFDGNSEDLNRVLSQLNTIETYQEAQDFIEDLVKPDFNYWKGKEDYEERFMYLIQKRFL